MSDANRLVRRVATVFGRLAGPALATAVLVAALASGGCISGEPCLCDDRELNPLRPGMDGRSSASLDPAVQPGRDGSTTPGAVSAATPTERTP